MRLSVCCGKGLKSSSKVQGKGIPLPGFPRLADLTVLSVELLLLI